MPRREQFDPDEAFPLDLGCDICKLLVVQGARVDQEARSRFKDYFTMKQTESLVMFADWVAKNRDRGRRGHL